MGTVPHGLIAAYGGDTVAAATKFADHFAGEMNVTVLVDFENDSVRTALEVADALGERLWGVRLDTSEALVDKALEGTDLRGVQPALVEKVRSALDDAGHEHVRIVASGGFTAAKIPEAKEVIDYASENSVALVTSKNWVQVADLLNRFGTQALNGEIPPDQALKTIQDQAGAGS